MKHSLPKCFPPFDIRCCLSIKIDCSSLSHFLLMKLCSNVSVPVCGNVYQYYWTSTDEFFTVENFFISINPYSIDNNVNCFPELLRECRFVVVADPIICVETSNLICCDSFPSVLEPCPDIMYCCISEKTMSNCLF